MVAGKDALLHSATKSLVVGDYSGRTGGEQDNEAPSRPLPARYYEQALAILREVGDRLGEAITLHNLASVEEARGQLDAAERHFHEALAIYTELGPQTVAHLVPLPHHIQVQLTNSWDGEMLFLVQHGCHVVAYEQRDHGRSG